MKVGKEETEKHTYLTEREKATTPEWIMEETEVEGEIEDEIAGEILEIEIGMTEEKEKIERIEKEIRKLKLFRYY